MARVDIVIPEPSPQYTEEHQRQINQSLRTMQDKLNTSYQRELKNEQDRMDVLLESFSEESLQKNNEIINNIKNIRKKRI